MQLASALLRRELRRSRGLRQGEGTVIASPEGLVCLTLGRFLCTKQGRWHFSRFGIIVGEVVRDMQGFSRGGEELNWRTSGDEGLWLHHFFFSEMETQAAACGSFPAEIFMDYVMFATSEDGDPQMYFPYKPRRRFAWAQWLLNPLPHWKTLFDESHILALFQTFRDT